MPVEEPPPPPDPTVLDARAPHDADQLHGRDHKEVLVWLMKLHRQIGHHSNRTLIRLLKNRGTHPPVLKLAETCRCDACGEARPPTSRHAVASYEAKPGYILHIDGLHWQHPVTRRHTLCQLMAGVTSHAPMIMVIEETTDHINKTNTTSEVDKSLLQ